MFFRCYYSLEAGHILRKVYNCRERKYVWPPNFFKFSVKKIFHFPKFPAISFSHLQENFDFIHKKFWRPFSSHFLHFCTNQPVCIIHSQNSRFSAFFSTLFHCSSSKFTTTTAQFPFYNCKLHSTTAQIVIIVIIDFFSVWNKVDDVLWRTGLVLSFWKYTCKSQ